MKSSFNMICSCVSRDIFGIKHEDQGWELNKPSDYEVYKYINFVSPLSLISKGIEISEVDYKRYSEKYKLENPRHFSNFFWRCKYFDITKKYENFLSSKKSDFFVVDNYIFQYDLLELEDSTILTHQNKGIVDFLIKLKILPPIKRTIHFQDLSYDEIDESIECFSKKIRRIYDDDKIILVEVKAAKFYLKDNMLHSFDLNKIQKLNSTLKMVFEILLKHFPNSHVISSPDVIFADSCHKWGLLPVHFINEYYSEYCLEQVNLIVQQCDDISKIKNITRSFNDYISCRYFSIVYSHLLNLTERKYAMKSDVYRIRTFHNTFVFFDFIEKKLIHCHKSNNDMVFDVYAFFETEKLYLYFYLNHNVYYIKSIISNDCIVEYGGAPSSFDVISNGSSISIRNNNKFLSAILNTDKMSLKDWNKDWEHFNICSN